MLPCRPVRAPVGQIAAPMFPDGIGWLNAEPIQMDRMLGRPVLIEFFDVCRVSSLRTLPYVKAWAAKYPGLRVISVHAPGYPPSHDLDVVRAAIQRLGIEHPVVVDNQMAVWRLYGNKGWPGRYLFDRTGKLVLVHYGEGEYADTERAIGECLGTEVEPMTPLRPEDAPGVLLEPQTADISLPADRGRLELVRDWADGEDWIAAADAGAAASFSYSAGAAYAALSEGGVEPGLYEVEGTVEAESPGLRLHGVQFTPVPPGPS